jgi:2-polyprenyl-6-methoxyphenol hydroxylase-like FAD-dependent oxidoreductase
MHITLLTVLQPLPSVKEWRETIHSQNDGTQPAEPGQRCSQIIFEAWLKRKCLEQKLIDGRFGWKFQTFLEENAGVTSTFLDLDGKEHKVRSQYILGCDGGGSRVRRAAGIKMFGGSL